MVFKHCLEMMMEKSFNDFITSIRKKINETRETHKDWNDFYNKSPPIISMISKGIAEKIKTKEHINTLYRGIPEKYSNQFPLLTPKNLILKENGNNIEILLCLDSALVEEMRIDWGYSFGFEIDDYSRSIIGYDDKKEIIKPFGLEIVIFSNKNLRHKEKIFNIYEIAEKHFLNIVDSQEFKVTGIKFSTNNSKCKKIQVW